MKKLVLIAMLWPTLLHAQSCPQPIDANTLVVSFTVPTDRKNGTPLPVSEIQSLRVLVDETQVLTIKPNSTVFKNQCFAVRLKCYRQGRVLHVWTVDTKNAWSAQPATYVLPQREKGVCP